MAEDRGLKTRGTFSTTVKIEILSEIRKLSTETDIPISKLTDQAFKCLLEQRASQK